MSREINLISHLPLFIQEYREMQGIMNAENPELQSVEDAAETAKDNMFILHTNEAGVRRYETMFGLTPAKDDSLYTRQTRVLSQYTNSVIHTMRGLIERLNMLCGVDNYTFKLIPDKYIIEIELYPIVENLIGTINSMLVEMLPANILWTCIIKCNRHEMLAVYPHYLLMQFTHQEMYEETIDDYISAKWNNISGYNAETLESIHCEHLVNFGMRKVG